MAQTASLGDPRVNEPNPIPFDSPKSADDIKSSLRKVEQTVAKSQENKTGENSGIKKSEDERIDETVLVDIETSSYDELVFWCRRLGMDYKGSKSDLIERLKELYGVSGKTGMVEKEGDKITIESAQKTQYYKIEEIDEDYIRIVGNVSVLLDDSKNGKKKVSHRISADYIIFNKKQKLMSAYGNVLYEKITDGSTDFFKGKSLVFNIDNWEGVIYQGVSQKEKKSEGGDGKSSSHTFYYSGEKLIKGKNDKIKMINGKISSSEGAFPLYSISADSIWVLGPGEWAIRGATMRVGEVPLMYLPFFLKWGDHFIFNPAVGKSDDVGQYLNTTFYFFGKKKDKGSADSFNFLDPSNGAEGAGEYQDGLFLRHGDKEKDIDYQRKLKLRKERKDKFEKWKEKQREKIETGKDKGHSTPMPSPPTLDENSQSVDKSEKIKKGNADDKKNIKEIMQERKKEWQEKYTTWKTELEKDWEAIKTSDSNYLKLMVDGYSNIGQFIGLDGDLSGLGNFTKIKFKGGLGFSYFGSSLNNASLKEGMPIIEKRRITDIDDVRINGLSDDNSYSYFGPVIDHSYLFGLLVPFRYGFEAEASYSQPKAYFKSDFKFELYSDSSFQTHFVKYRQETFDFERALGLTEDDPIYQSAESKKQLNWYMNNSFNGLQGAFSPEAQKYVKSLSISKLDFKIDYIQKSFTDVKLNVGKPGAPRETLSKEYFVPQKMQLPNIEMSMSGTFFDKSYSAGGSNLPSENSDKDFSDLEGIRSPWGKSASNDSKKDKSDHMDPVFVDELKKDALFSDIAIDQSPVSTLFSHSLTYNLRSLAFRIDGEFIDETPETPEVFHQLGKNSTLPDENKSIIDYQLSKMLLNLKGDVNFSYNAKILDNIISVSDTITMSSNYQKTFYNNSVIDKKGDTSESSVEERDESEDEKANQQTYNILDYKASNVSIKNQFQLKINPFERFEPLRGSYISYTLNNTLLDFRYNEKLSSFELKKALWDSRNVDSHSIKSLLKFSVMDMPQSIAVDLFLPPEEVVIKPRINTNFGLLKNSLSFDVKKLYQDEANLSDQTTISGLTLGAMNLRDIQNDDHFNSGLNSWYVSTVNLNSDLDFNNGIKVSNKFRYNPVTQSITGLDSSFMANLYDNKIRFHQSLNIAETNSILRPTKASIGLDLWYLSVNFDAADKLKKKFDWTQYAWITDPDSPQQQLIPENLRISFKYNYQSKPLWKNRIDFSFNIGTEITYKFQEYTSSALTFNLGFTFNIFHFISISLSMSSENRSLYLYSQLAVDRINVGNTGDKIEKLSFFEDLFRSFGSIDDRKASHFNLKKINLDITHFLGEWKLVLHFDGSPRTFNPLTNIVSNTSSWKRNFSVSVIWGAIDMIKTDIKIDTNDKLTF